MNKKFILGLSLIFLMITGIISPITATGQQIESTHKFSTIYEFSISYTNQNTRFNTKSELNITYMQNGSEFLSEGISIWHLPVNITTSQIRDLLAFYLPMTFTDYLESHLKNESVSIPYQQRLLSNSSLNFTPALYNPFLMKNVQNQSLQLNDSVSLISVSQSASGIIREIKQVGFASWSSEPLSLAFAHSFVTAAAVNLTAQIENRIITMLLLYELESGVLIKGEIQIESQTGNELFSNQIKLVGSTIELKQEQNPNIYFYFALTAAVPTIISIIVIFLLYKRTMKQKKE